MLDGWGGSIIEVMVANALISLAGIALFTVIINSLSSYNSAHTALKLSEERLKAEHFVTCSNKLTFSHEMLISCESGKDLNSKLLFLD